MIRRDQQGGPQIAIATVADLDDIMDIERASYSSPWPRSIFLDELARDWAQILLLSPTPGSSPVASLVIWRVCDEIHVLNVATHPSHRRRGFAGLLLRRAISQGRAQGARYVTLEVRRSNVAALKLYERFGFNSIGVRPKYYAENQEDAIVMLLEMKQK